MVLLIACAGLAVRTLGLEFLPKLEEGNLWIRATMPTSISLEEGNGYVNRMRQIMRSFPEVVTVVSQHGRPDDGTDATGFFNAEFFVPLKPADTWPGGIDKAALTDRMNRDAGSRIPRRRLQFFAVHRGQRRGSGVRREGRELGQAVRRRSGYAGTHGGPDQGRNGDRAGHRRSRGAHLAWPAHGADRHRPREGGALRTGAGRHQRHDPGSDRRPGGRQSVRAGERPQLPDRRAAGAEIPQQSGRDPPPADRRRVARRRQPCSFR